MLRRWVRLLDILLLRRETKLANALPSVGGMELEEQMERGGRLVERTVDVVRMRLGTAVDVR